MDSSTRGCCSMRAHEEVVECVPGESGLCMSGCMRAFFFVCLCERAHVRVRVRALCY